MASFRSQPSFFFVSTLTVDNTDLKQAVRGKSGHRMYRLQPSLACFLSSSPVASTSYASYSAASSSSCIAGASSLRQRQKQQQQQQQRWSSRAAYNRPTTTTSSYTHASRKNGPALFHPSPSSITSTFFLKSSSSSYPSSCIRCFAHLANRQDSSTSSTTDPKSPSTTSSKAASTATSTYTPAAAANPSTTLGKSSNLTIDTAPASKETNNKEQRLRDIQIIKRLLPNIWPKGDTGTKARVVIAIALLIGGKVGHIGHTSCAGILILWPLLCSSSTSKSLSTSRA